MMPWDDIRYFLALARHGSLSGAARALQVEHSTVSRRVGHLETEIGNRLFDRLSRGWQLTIEGQDLLARAESVEEAVLGFSRSASGVDPLAGPVRVSAPPLLLSHLILPGLSGFLAAHRGITLELIGERRVADLMRAEADIAIRLEQTIAPDLVVRSLGAVSYGLYGLRRWTERAKDEHVYLGFDDSIPALEQKSWLDDYAAGLPVSVRSNDLGTLLNGALKGLGLALLPDVLARLHPELVAVTLERPAPRLSAFMVMHPDIRRSRRVRLAADHLVTILTEALAADSKVPQP